MSQQIRVRFPPSPTGDLHIGGVRTALFNYLFAKAHQGEMVLRFEDTDRERSTQAAVDNIVEGLAWLGLDFDQGPFYQTERLARYQEVIEKLCQSGKAYRCCCSKERLQQLREDQLANKEKPRYDGRCREENIPEDTPSVVRLRTPDSGEVCFDDAIKGKICIANKELDDLIIARSDGMPTYHLTVVVDDIDMGITHVIRGDDHINNTPRQIHIIEALGKVPPVYAHMPMILGSDGKRLSKRHGALSVMAYQQMGILPQAMLNYLLRLGFSSGDQEIFSKEQMEHLFQLDGVNQSAARFDGEKLLWLNQHYLKTLPLEALLEEVKRFNSLDFVQDTGPNFKEVLEVERERVKTLEELVQNARLFYQEDMVRDEKAWKKHIESDDAQKALQALLESFSELSDWQKDKIHQALKETASSIALKLGKVAQPLRVAVTGGTVSPSIDATCYLLGKAKVLARIKAAIL